MQQNGQYKPWDGKTGVEMRGFGHGGIDSGDDQTRTEVLSEACDMRKIGQMEMYGSNPHSAPM